MRERQVEEPDVNVTLFESVSFARRFILKPLMRLFDAIWRLLYFIVGAIIFGGVLVNVLISLATTGTLGFADPATWPIVRPFLASPMYALITLGGLVCLGLASFLAHRNINRDREPISRELVEEFGLSRVRDAVPTPSMIRFFRPNVYIPRRLSDAQGSADDFALKSLVDAAKRTDSFRMDEQVGICVVGRSLSGASRLAWQAVKADDDLGSWIFVRWPENPTRYVELWDALQQHHARVVLWLDDLSRYRDDRSSAIIARLPYDLQQKRIPFVVAATVPNDTFLEQIRARYGKMLDYLAKVRPADMTSSEAMQLVSELSSAGEIVYQVERFDGTPGSIVFAIDRMRDEVYPRLPDGAKTILRTMKLLRSAGIREYNQERVLTTAARLFPPARSNWTHEVDALRTTGFVQQTVIDNGRLTMLEPIVDVYLDVAVPEYADLQACRADWPKLLDSFVATADAGALVRLGNAFRKSGDDSRAETCYRRALDHLTRGTAEQDWAMAQFGLGDVIRKRVDSAEPSERRKLLEQSEEAFNSVLTVISQKSDPTFWADVQGRLASIIRHEATTTVGRKKRIEMLDIAAQRCRDALKYLRRDTAPEEWAEAQKNLGLVLFTHAQFAQDANARRRMLDSALDAFASSLTVYTPEAHVFNWSKVRRHVGDTSRVRADAANRPRKDQLLEQAINAYADAVGPNVPELLWRPTERGEILNQLSMCALVLGGLQSGSSRDDLLAQATDWAKAWIELDLENKQEAAGAYQRLAAIQFERAMLAPSESRLVLLDAAIQANLQALSVLGRQGQRELRPQIRLELARLYWERVSLGDQVAPLEAPKDVEATLRYASQALEYFTNVNDPSKYRLAVRLRRDATNKATAMGVTPARVRVTAPANVASSEDESVVVENSSFGQDSES